MCNDDSHLIRDCPNRGGRDAENKRAALRGPLVQGVAVDDTIGPTDDTAKLVARAMLNDSDDVRRSRLQHADLVWAGVPTNAIVDTGCEITVMQEARLPDGVEEPSGVIQLTSVFGQSIKAKLTCLPVHLKSAGSIGDDSELSIVCALTDHLAPGVDCLLTREDWELLSGTDPQSAPDEGEPTGVAQGVLEAQITAAQNSGVGDPLIGADGGAADGDAGLPGNDGD